MVETVDAIFNRTPPFLKATKSSRKRPLFFVVNFIGKNDGRVHRCVHAVKDVSSLLILFPVATVERDGFRVLPSVENKLMVSV